jgi:hypothetical protein
VYRKQFDVILKGILARCTPTVLYKKKEAAQPFFWGNATLL